MNEEVTGQEMNPEQLTAIQETLEKQLEILETQQKKQEEQEKALAKEEQQLAEEQKVQEEENAKQMEIEQEDQSTQIELYQSVVDNTESTNDVMAQLLQVNENMSQSLHELRDEMELYNKGYIEGFWMIGLAIAIAVGFKIFFDQSMKW